MTVYPASGRRAVGRLASMPWALGDAGASRRLGAAALESVPVVAGLAGVGLWGLALAGAEVDRMGQLGLVTVLGWPYFAAVALLSLGFAWQVVRGPARSGRLVVLLLGLVLVLFATAPALQPVARLTDSWIHAGFVRYMLDHGAPLQNFDARFSWPGAFSLGAVVASFTGYPGVEVLLRWAPLGFELAYLPALLVIARAAGVGRRAAWVGTALFYATNWIDQDYFSPQALNVLFFLVVVAVVMSTWEPVAARLSSRLSGAERGTGASAGRRWWRHAGTSSRAAVRALGARRLGGHEAQATRSRGAVAGLLLLLLLVMLASALSHQLSPYAIVLALAACLLTARLGRPELVVAAVLVPLAWLSLGASNYWVGHLSEIFGGVGQFGSVVGANVGARVTGSASHRLVVELRIWMTVAVFCLALLGVLRRKATTRTVELLSGAPFVFLFLHGYGGEVLMRATLFSSPFACLLAATAIAPVRAGSQEPWLRLWRPGSARHPRRGVALSVAVVAVTIGALAAGTTVTRGGNDAYESYSKGELAAVNFVYSHARAGQVMGMLAPYLPAGARRVGQILVFSDDGGGNPRAYDPSGLLRVRPAWVVLGRAQENWGRIVMGYRAGWENAVERSLLNAGYVTAASWPTARVLEYRGAQ